MSNKKLSLKGGHFELSIPTGDPDKDRSEPFCAIAVGDPKETEFSVIEGRSVSNPLYQPDNQPEANAPGSSATAKPTLSEAGPALTVRNEKVEEKVNEVTNPLYQPDHPADPPPKPKANNPSSPSSLAAKPLQQSPTSVIPPQPPQPASSSTILATPGPTAGPPTQGQIPPGGPSQPLPNQGHPRLSTAPANNVQQPVSRAGPPTQGQIPPGGPSQSLPNQGHPRLSTAPANNVQRPVSPGASNPIPQRVISNQHQPVMPANHAGVLISSQRPANQPFNHPGSLRAGVAHPVRPMAGPIMPANMPRPMPTNIPRPMQQVQMVQTFSRPHDTSPTIIVLPQPANQPCYEPVPYQPPVRKTISAQRHSPNITSYFLLDCCHPHQADQEPVISSSNPLINEERVVEIVQQSNEIPLTRIDMDDVEEEEKERKVAPSERVSARRKITSNLFLDCFRTQPDSTDEPRAFVNPAFVEMSAPSDEEPQKSDDDDEDAVSYTAIDMDEDVPTKVEGRIVSRRKFTSHPLLSCCQPQTDEVHFVPTATNPAVSIEEVPSVPEERVVTVVMQKAAPVVVEAVPVVKQSHQSSFSLFDCCRSQPIHEVAIAPDPAIPEDKVEDEIPSPSEEKTTIVVIQQQQSSPLLSVPGDKYKNCCFPLNCFKSQLSSEVDNQDAPETSEATVTEISPEEASIALSDKRHNWNLESLFICCRPKPSDATQVTDTTDLPEVAEQVQQTEIIEASPEKASIVVSNRRRKWSFVSFFSCCRPKPNDETVPDTTDSPAVAEQVQQTLTVVIEASPEETSIAMSDKRHNWSLDPFFRCCRPQPHDTTEVAVADASDSSQEVVEQVQQTLTEVIEISPEPDNRPKWSAFFSCCRPQPSDVSRVAAADVTDSQEVAEKVQQTLTEVTEAAPEEKSTAVSDRRQKWRSFFSCCQPQPNEDTQVAAADVTDSPEVAEPAPLPQTHTEEAIVLREEIVHDLFEEVQQLELQEQHGYEVETRENCCCQCIDTCCQSHSCSLPSFNLFGRNRQRDRSPKPPKKELMTQALTKAKNKGSKMINRINKRFFKNFKKLILFLWVTPEFILTLIGFILSVVTLSLDQNRAFNIFHFVLIVVATGFACVDFAETLHSFCCGEKKKRSQDKKDPPPANCKNKFCSFVKESTGYIRIIVTELILYPLLICDIFEVTTGKGFEPDTAGDRLGIFLFVVSCIYFVLYVYVARIVVLCGMIWNISTVRTPEKEVLDKHPQSAQEFDPDIKRSATYYQTGFTIHVILQMLAQVLMFIAIAAKIRFDNRHFYEPNNTDESIHVSNYLWYMIISGSVLPIMGLFSFFVATYYWSRMFPIGVYIDMMKIMKMTECGAEDLVDSKNAIAGQQGVAGKLVHQFAKLRNVEQDFKNLRNDQWFNKFKYPFLSPALVVFCTVYLALQLAFILCAALAVDEMGQIAFQVLNGGGWVVYYIFAVIVGVIANAYVFLITGFWIAVVVTVLLIIAMIIAVIVCLLFLSCLGSSNSNSNRQYR